MTTPDVRIPPRTEVGTGSPVAVPGPAFGSTFASATRRGAAWRALTFGGALGVLGVLAWGVSLPKIPLCVFQVFVGRPCPGCGMTRAVTAAVRGDLLHSLRMHPLGVVLVGLTLYGFAGAVAGLLGRRDFARDAVERRGVRAAVVLCVLLVGIWVVRGFLVPAWSPDPIGKPAWATAFR